MLNPDTAKGKEEYPNRQEFSTCERKGWARFLVMQLRRSSLTRKQLFLRLERMRWPKGLNRFQILVYAHWAIVAIYSSFVAWICMEFIQHFKRFIRSPLVEKELTFPFEKKTVKAMEVSLIQEMEGWANNNRLLLYLTSVIKNRIW